MSSHNGDDGPVRNGTDLDHHALVDALRAHAKGLYASEAATGLLIEHDSWLRRWDFLALIEVIPHLFDGYDMARIDWEDLANHDLPGSGSEWHMLNIIRELAGVNTGFGLGELLSGLDDTNTQLVLRAILHHHGGAGATPVITGPFEW